MTRALAHRLARLEHHARRVISYADLVASLDRLMAQAGAAMGLHPVVVQGMCIALHHTLQTVGHQAPRVLRTAQDIYAVEPVVRQVLLTTIDTQVADPDTRTRLRAQLHQAVGEEAKRCAGMS